MDNLDVRATELALHLSDEQYCRQRADLFRHMAEQASAASRRLLLAVAGECDEIADNLLRSRFCGASWRLG
jgi:hypothetical protein